MRIQSFEEAVDMLRQWASRAGDGTHEADQVLARLVSESGVSISDRELLSYWARCSDRTESDAVALTKYVKLNGDGCFTVDEPVTEDTVTADIAAMRADLDDVQRRMNELDAWQNRPERVRELTLNEVIDDLNRLRMYGAASHVQRMLSATLKGPGL